MTVPLGRIEFHRNWYKTSGVMALAVVMLTGAGFLTTLPQWRAQVAGWFGLVVFSPMLILFAREVVRGGPVVVIDAHGLTDRRSGMGTLRWEDVKAAGVGRLNGNRFLWVELADRERYIGRLSWWRRLFYVSDRRLGFGDLSIGFVGLTPGLDVAANAVDRWLRHRS